MATIKQFYQAHLDAQYADDAHPAYIAYKRVLERDPTDEMGSCPMDSCVGRIAESAIREAVAWHYRTTLATADATDDDVVAALDHRIEVVMIAYYG